MSQSIAPVNGESRLEKDAPIHTRSRVRTRSASKSETDKPALECQDENVNINNTKISTNNNITSNNVNNNPVSNTSSQTWQYTSSSRCLTCGRLGCTSCGVKIDPLVKRQKLESLRLNTPYERAKLMRYSEELRTDEVKRRRKITEAWENGMDYLMQLVQFDLQLVRLIAIESEQRHECERAERLFRLHFASQIDVSVLCVSLYTHEREARNALQAVLNAERMEIYRAEREEMTLLQLLRREVCTREAICFNEAAERERVKTQEVHHAQCCSLYEDERRECMGQYMHIMHNLYNAWCEEMNYISLEANAHLSFIHEQIRERALIDHAAQLSAQEIVTEEESCRVQLYEKYCHANDWMVERIRLFQEHCVALDRMEYVARLDILTEQDRELHDLIVMCDNAQDAMDAWMEEQLIQRVELFQQVEEVYEHIWMEAGQEYKWLCNMEVEERNARYAWMLHKAHECLEYCKKCEKRKMEIVEEESNERQHVYSLRQQEELEVTERVVMRQRMVEDLWECTRNSMHDIYKAEHNARFTLYALMAEHEERVHRWIASKAQQVLDLIHFETHARHELVTFEADEWSTVMYCASSDVEQRRSRAVALTERLKTLVHECEVEVYKLINVHEVQERVQLYKLHDTERTEVVLQIHYRQLAELQENEVQARLLCQREEMQEFATVQTQFSLWIRCLCTESQSILHAKIDQIQIDEWQCRTLLEEEFAFTFHACEVEWANVCERVCSLMKEQNEAALHNREAYMAEAKRMYDESEELSHSLMCHSTPYLQNEGSINTSSYSYDRTNNYNNSSSKSGMLMQRVHDNQNALSIELIRQTLLPYLNTNDSVAKDNNNNNYYTTHVENDTLLISTLSVDALAFLVNMLQEINEHVTLSQKEVERMRGRAEDSARRVAQQQSKLASEKDKKEQYVRNRKRQAEERAVRVQNDLAEKQQGEQQITVERKRLRKLQSTLKQKTAQLEALKRNIHQQYKREKETLDDK